MSTPCPCVIVLEPWEVAGYCAPCLENPVNPEALKARRLALQLSQDQLASLLGVTQQYISAAETLEPYARPWYDLALRCMEYEERIEKLPRKRRSLK